MRRTDKGLLNLKDLLSVFPPDGGATISGFSRQSKRGDGNLLIQQQLMEDLMRRTEKGLLNLKDLLIVLPPDGGAIISGFVRQSKRGEADLLIQHGLLAKLARRADEGLLIQKGLLIGLPPSLERSFEDESRFKASFLCRIPPNPAIFRQKRPDNGRKSEFFATDFIRGCRVLRLVSGCNRRVRRWSK